MPYRFDGKVVLITGAASGIGRASAIKLHGLGASLALSDLNDTGLADTDALCGGKHVLEKLDVGSSTAVTAHVNHVISKLGQIDHVFNCAGINPTAYPLVETTDEYFEKLMSANLRGLYNVTKAVIPYMKSGSSMVNVSSRLGLYAASQMAIYSMTKFGILGFSKCMALELGPKGIRVNVIAPGFIDTPTNAYVVAGPEVVRKQEARVALGRLGTAEEVADTVAFLFSDESRYCNGSVLEINGGIG